MELLTCPNCRAVYGDAHERCPTCEADHHGAGGRVELDTTARAAVARHGGIFGGVLEAGESDFLLWCAKGVCLYSDEAGLVWDRGTGRRVDGVQLDAERVRLSCGGAEILLDRRDGSRVDRGQRKGGD